MALRKGKSERSKKIAKLDAIFSRFIRLRDSKEYNHKAFRCISCGELKPYEQSDCGHYISRRFMATRYSEINCNAQCRFCNRFSEGNFSGYREGLIKKYGEEKVLRLEAAKNSISKVGIFELEEFITYYKNKVNEYKVK